MGKLSRMRRLGGRFARKLGVVEKDRPHQKSVQSTSGLVTNSKLAKAGSENEPGMIPAAESSEPEVDGVSRLSAGAVRAKIKGLKGPALINHWASWCEGCVDELPQLSDLHAKYGSDVEFLGVSWESFQFERDDVLSHVASFSRQHGANWPSVVVDDAPNRLFEALEMTVHTIPQIWVLNGSGDVVYRLEEVLDEEECVLLENVLQEVTS